MAVLTAQITFQNYQIPLWNGRGYVWVKMSSHFTLNNGVLDVAIPAAPAVVQRAYSVPLTFEATVNGYPLPIPNSNVVVYVNGLRYMPGVDYLINGGVVQAMSTNWPPPADTMVSIDYDKP